MNLRLSLDGFPMLMDVCSRADRESEGGEVVSVLSSRRKQKSMRTMMQKMMTKSLESTASSPRHILTTLRRCLLELKPTTEDIENSIDNENWRPAWMQRNKLRP